MNFDSIEAVRAENFLGFLKVRELKDTKCGAVPDAAGVYLVLRDPSLRPTFIATSKGGHFKGRRPEVSVQELEDNWVERAAIIYIGKAGGGDSRSTLKRRIGAYMRFGSGRPVGHWGGRFIWQLADCDDLIVCWQVTDGIEPEARERDLIRAFSGAYGRRPFANLRD
jgi:hypothetical protein